VIESAITEDARTELQLSAIFFVIVSTLQPPGLVGIGRWETL
jgi:hypothetical protein